MNASCNPSIATEVHARHKRPHRLALLATSPVATGEAKIEGTERTSSLPCQSGGGGPRKRWKGRHGRKL